MICLRGAPVAKPKSYWSSVLIAGKPATRANISRARARRDSRSATSSSSRKSVNEVRFSAAVWASAGYCAAIPPSRSSLHSSISRSCCTLIPLPPR